MNMHTLRNLRITLLLVCLFCCNKLGSYRIWSEIVSDHAFIQLSYGHVADVCPALDQLFTGMNDLPTHCNNTHHHWGHALMRNLRNGFSDLTDAVPLNLRLAVAWPQLALAI
jgi:hypothetical protein